MVFLAPPRNLMFYGCGLGWAGDVDQHDARPRVETPSFGLGSRH